MIARVACLSFLIALLAGYFLLPGSASRAEASCYENVGCPSRDRFSDSSLSSLSCQNLAFVRNTIFADNGYCFTSPKYRELFEGRSCRYRKAADVPLNRIERANIRAITRVEARKGCRG